MDTYKLLIWCPTCDKSLPPVALAIASADLIRIIRAHEASPAHMARIRPKALPHA